MRQSILRFVGMAAAASMVMSASVANATPTPAASQINPWQALSVLSGGASTIAYCGAAAAAQAGAGCVLPQIDAAREPVPVQVIDQPLPPPLPVANAPFAISPLLIAIGVLAVAGIAYLLLRKKNNNNGPNSPV